MITAVDTNILLDILIPNAAYVDASDRALAEASRQGAVVLSDVVYGELAAWFPGQAEFDLFLATTGLQVVPPGRDALFQAGIAWRAYSRRRSAELECPQCGQTHVIHCDRCGRGIAPRQHILSDFIIGAHALVHADRLLTRDRGYYATYFSQLALVQPS